MNVQKKKRERERQRERERKEEEEKRGEGIVTQTVKMKRVPLQGMTLWDFIHPVFNCMTDNSYRRQLTLLFVVSLVIRVTSVEQD